jgi:hypothetical protein
MSFRSSSSSLPYSFSSAPSPSIIPNYSIPVDCSSALPLSSSALYPPSAAALLIPPPPPLDSSSASSLALSFPRSFSSLPPGPCSSLLLPTSKTKSNNEENARKRRKSNQKPPSPSVSHSVSSSSVDSSENQNENPKRIKQEIPSKQPTWPSSNTPLHSAACLTNDGNIAIARYLLHFPSDSALGAQSGLYQTAKPSELVIVMSFTPDSALLLPSEITEIKAETTNNQSNQEKWMIRLPVKVALKPTVKRTAKLRNLAEFSLHPLAFNCESSDLGIEEQVWETNSKLKRPDYLLLRKDTGMEIHVIFVNSWFHFTPSAAAEELIHQYSPLHFKPVSDEPICHVQTKGRGKNEERKKETQQVYLSLKIGKWYEIKTHHGWIIEKIQLRHYKGGEQCATRELTLHQLPEHMSTQEAVQTIVGNHNETQNGAILIPPSQIIHGAKKSKESSAEKHKSKSSRASVKKPSEIQSVPPQSVTAHPIQHSLPNALGPTFPTSFGFGGASQSGVGTSTASVHSIPFPFSGLFPAPFHRPSLSLSLPNSRRPSGSPFDLPQPSNLPPQPASGSQSPVRPLSLNASGRESPQSQPASSPMFIVPPPGLYFNSSGALIDAEGNTTDPKQFESEFAVELDQKVSEWRRTLEERRDSLSLSGFQFPRRDSFTLSRRESVSLPLSIPMNHGNVNPDIESDAHDGNDSATGNTSAHILHSSGNSGVHTSASLYPPFAPFDPKHIECSGVDSSVALMGMPGIPSLGMNMGMGNLMLSIPHPMQSNNVLVRYAILFFSFHL